MLHSVLYRAGLVQCPPVCVCMHAAFGGTFVPSVCWVTSLFTSKVGVSAGLHLCLPPKWVNLHVHVHVQPCSTYTVYRCTNHHSLLVVLTTCVNPY